jgi:hypothetical protein
VCGTRKIGRLRAPVFPSASIWSLPYIHVRACTLCDDFVLEPSNVVYYGCDVAAMNLVEMLKLFGYSFISILLYLLYLLFGCCCS